MKKYNKKKKKKGSRKKAHSKATAKIISEPDSRSIPVETEAKRKPPQVAPKRETEKRGAEKGSIFKYVNVAGQFLRESKMELKKVKWPTRKELLASTAMVIFLVIVVSFFLGLIDFGLIKLIKNIVG